MGDLTDYFIAGSEGILTGTDPMGIIGEGEDPVADGGNDGPWVLRVRRSLVAALAGADQRKLSDVAADKSLYRWMSL